MPILVTTTSGGTAYTSPFVGTIAAPIHLKIDLSGLTTDEVDSAGYLKPGVPFTSAVPAVLPGANTFVYGVTVEATKLPITVPPTNTTLGAETGDCMVAVTPRATINRDLAEDNLGRAYSANELAAFIAAGARFTITTT